MNKKLYTLCAIAAAFVLAGCQKETNNEPAYVGPTHTLTFTAEKMLDSKTAIASEENGLVSYKWNEGDEERMEILEFFEYDDNGTTKTKCTKGTITGMTLTNNDKSATFTATFTGDAPETLLYYQAAYAGSFANTSHNPQIPAAQSPLPDTFDPAADILVSEQFDNGRDATTFVFDMTRKVSVNKMTLKGLTPGEVISTVTFESDKQHAATYVLNTGNYSGAGKKLTFTYTSNNTVPSSGEFPVYFTTAPVTDATFTVTVITDQNKYRKTSTKTISFATREVRRFGVNLSGCEVPDGRAFTLVEDVDDLVIGSDVVIAAHGETNLAMSTTQNSNNRGSVTATKSADWSTIDVDDQVVQIFTLTNGTQPGTYAFLCKNGGGLAGKYIYAASSTNNYLRTQNDLDDNASWTISITDKNATITAQGENTRNILRRNGELFACYASGQQPVFIYQAAGLPAANLSFTEASYTFTLGDSDYTSFTGQTLNNPNNISDITWTSSNTDLATVDSDGEITWVADATGTTTITATFVGDDFFGAGNASYTIKVNPASSGSGLPFLETFDECTGTMGWSGSYANGDFIPDHSGWFYSNAYGAEGAARFGKSSGLGSAQTPEIEYSGNATLTFKAGAWNGNSESTNLKLSVSSGALYGDASLTIPISSVTLVKGDWTTYTVYLKNLESPFTVTFEGNAASNSRFFLDDVSIVAGIVQPAAEFGATMSNTDNVLAAGGTKTINVTGNVAWTASVTGNATVTPASGAGIGSVTVSILANTNSSTATYTATVSTTADVTPNSYQFTITQEAAPSVVNESTEADPYTPAEAAALADELSGGTMDDVYVYGIISKITTAYSSQYNNVSFDISIDGKDTGSQQFRIYRTAATSADDYVVGDAVEFKGTLTKYNSTYELEQGSTLIAQLHKPTISPNGASFTTSQSVTITADSGSTIRYTTNGDDPTASSSVYSSALNLTATTTVKAIAIKGILTTGVASATFTKNSGGSGPTTGDILFSTDFGSSAVALASYTGGTSYNNASSITYTASNTTYVKIDTGTAGNMTSANLFIGGKNGGAGLTATIAGIKTYGATSVTVTWAANNANSKVSIPGSSTAAVTSANSASNSATFTLSGTETTISLVFTGIGKNNTRVDNVSVVYN
jgi:hypothetical protein